MGSKRLMYNLGPRAQPIHLVRYHLCEDLICVVVGTEAHDAALLGFKFKVLFVATSTERERWCQLVLL